jgi:coenzyme PQQ precursor peptide PqqA
MQQAWTFQASFPLSHESLFEGPVQLVTDRFKSQTKTTITFTLESVMKTKVWIRPEVKEVNLGCEINCYAPAEI